MPFSPRSEPSWAVSRATPSGCFSTIPFAWPVLDFYGYAEAYAEVRHPLQRVGSLDRLWLGGFTPIPYKVVTIASGAMHLDIWVFVAASAASRGLRFAIEAALLSWFAVPVRSLVERHLTLAGLAMLAALVVGFVAIRWIL